MGEWNLGCMGGEEQNLLFGVFGGIWVNLDRNYSLN